MAVLTCEVKDSSNTLFAKGIVVDLGEGITDHGHCWSINENPTLNDAHTSLGIASKTGNFFSSLPMLPTNLYFIRAFVTDGPTIIYGDNRYFGDTSQIIKIFDPYNTSVWVMGTESGVVWRDLKEESVFIKLYRGNTFILALDGRYVSKNKIYWDVPLNLVQGSDYRIKIIGYKSGFIGQSSQFTISPRQPKGAKMVYVDGGSFKMGSSSGGAGEQPVHTVTVNDYEVNSYEITNQQYADFLNVYKSETVVEGAFKEANLINLDGAYGDIKSRIYKQNNTYLVEKGFENFPVIYLTWYGAYIFCEYYGGRLPTEAEWEYAAKGGKFSKGFTYSGGNDYNLAGWHEGNSDKTVHQVGKKLANELNLYDMSGNVWEWCSDWYGEFYYSSSEPKNPKGAESGVYKVRRGGCWDYNKSSMIVTARATSFPNQALSVIGFRLVRSR
jgi:formylglycine-generating enzyme required for sulfatase activity